MGCAPWKPARLCRGEVAPAVTVRRRMNPDVTAALLVSADVDRSCWLNRSELIFCLLRDKLSMKTRLPWETKVCGEMLNCPSNVPNPLPRPRVALLVVWCCINSQWEAVRTVKIKPKPEPTEPISSSVFSLLFFFYCGNGLQLWSSWHPLPLSACLASFGTVGTNTFLICFRLHSFLLCVKIRCTFAQQLWRQWLQTVSHPADTSVIPPVCRNTSH